jgi:DNA-binding transcriptional LysR family regulator
VVSLALSTILVFVAIARDDLPVDPTTIDGFAGLPHVVISRRGHRRSRIDDILATHGLDRRVALTVPTLAMAIQAVATTALVTVAPAILTSHQLPPVLRPYALPVPTPEIPAVLAWHSRHDRDSAHRWLRATISEMLRNHRPDSPEPQVKRPRRR